MFLLTLSSGHGGDTAADEAAGGDTVVVVLESSSSFSSEAADLLSSSPSLRLLFTDRRCDDAVAVAEHIIADCRSRGSLMTAKNSVSAGTNVSFSVHDFVDSTSQKINLNSILP